MRRIAPHAAAAARALGDLARTMAVCAAVAVTACLVSAQEDPRASQALLLRDAERFLDHPDPRLRGEAALAIGSSKDPRHLPKILAVANSGEATARTLGLLALGYLGAPGSESTLTTAMGKPGAKTDATMIAAAFALGRLPADHGSEALSQRLAAFSEASYKRQRDILLAMASGLLDRGGDDAAAALERLAKDAALRDPAAKAAVLTALATPKRSLDLRLFEPALTASAPEVRIAGLHAFQLHEQAGRERVSAIARLASSDADPSVRAAALRCLSQLRHAPALDMAQKAIRSAHPGEAEQGVATMLHLGGEPARRNLERQFPYLSAPAQRMVLAATTSPVGSDFLAACQETALDARRDLATRAEAMAALLRTGQHVSSHALAEVFAGKTSHAARAALASAFRSEAHASTMLAACPLPCTTANAQDCTSMLTTLLAADAQGARRKCAEALQAEMGVESNLAALRALRRTALPALSAKAQRFVPDALRAILMP